jgi:hypothetical protein
MPKLTVGYLYPSVMCHYGDRGNLICLTKRCEWRGIEIEVQHLERGDAVDPDRVDLFLMGGGADSHQRLIADDMVNGKGEAVKTSIEDGAAALMVCGGYQLWGEFYRAYDGTELLSLEVGFGASAMPARCAPWETSPCSGRIAPSSVSRITEVAHICVPVHKRSGAFSRGRETIPRTAGRGVSTATRSAPISTAPYSRRIRRWPII